MMDEFADMPRDELIIRLLAATGDALRSQQEVVRLSANLAENKLEVVQISFHLEKALGKPHQADVIDSMIRRLRSLAGVI